jgi:hypothetical protein
MGAPDSLVRHRTDTVGCPVRRPRHPTVRVQSEVDRWSFVSLLHRTVRCYTGQSGATPDSPVPSDLNEMLCSFDVEGVLFLGNLT